MKREEGYYWCKHHTDKDWMVLYYNSNTDAFYNGDEMVFISHSKYWTINENRILPPNE